jgi:type IV secretion system protein VirB8
MKRDPVVERYLQDARTWELDRTARAESSTRRAWWVAGASTVAAVASTIAVAGLTPLKQPVPVIIRVDSSTGIVDLVPTYQGTTNIPELVSRQLLSSYVIARERYFYGTAEADYELVASQNSPQLNQDWAAQWNRANPQSPLNQYKDGTTVRTQVRSITFLKLESGRQDVAQVRFTKYARAGGTGAERATHWISTIEFTYAKPSGDESVRSLNPLGFRVVEYHREPEVVPQTASVKGTDS